MLTDLEPDRSSVEPADLEAAGSAIVSTNDMEKTVRPFL